MPISASIVPEQQSSVPAWQDGEGIIYKASKWWTSRPSRPNLPFYKVGATDNDWDNISATGGTGGTNGNGADEVCVDEQYESAPDNPINSFLLRGPNKKEIRYLSKFAKPNMHTHTSRKGLRYIFNHYNRSHQRDHKNQYMDKDGKIITRMDASALVYYKRMMERGEEVPFSNPFIKKLIASFNADTSYLAVCCLSTGQDGGTGDDPDQCISPPPPPPPSSVCNDVNPPAPPLIGSEEQGPPISASIIPIGSSSVPAWQDGEGIIYKASKWWKSAAMNSYPAINYAGGAPGGTMTPTVTPTPGSTYPAPITPPPAAGITPIENEVVDNCVEDEGDLTESLQMVEVKINYSAKYGKQAPLKERFSWPDTENRNMT